MLIQNNTILPNVAIFLDIDGVLGPNTFTIMQARDHNEIVRKLTGDRFHTYNCNRCITCKTAEAQIFKKQVVKSLHDLINKIKDIANVHIVISSTWREKRTIDDLKQIFHMHEFSKYIIDKTIEIKTPFDHWKDHCVYPHVDLTLENCIKHSKDPSKQPTEKEFEDFIYKNWECRASQIARWIKDHPEYAGFIIFDDLDEHLSDNFNDKFISTAHPDEKILKPEDCEKAYQSILNQLGINI